MGTKWGQKSNYVLNYMEMNTKYKIQQTSVLIQMFITDLLDQSPLVSFLQVMRVAVWYSLSNRVNQNGSWKR